MEALAANAPGDRFDLANRGNTKGSTLAMQAKQWDRERDISGR